MLNGIAQYVANVLDRLAPEIALAAVFAAGMIAGYWYCKAYSYSKRLRREFASFRRAYHKPTNNNRLEVFDDCRD